MILTARAVTLTVLLAAGTVNAQDWKKRLEIHFGQGQYDSVCAIYEENIQSKLTDPTSYALQGKAAKSYYYSDRLEQSLNLYEKLFNEAINDSALYMRTLLDYSLVLIETGQYKNAYSQLHRCRTMVHYYGDINDKARLYNRFAVYYLRTSDYRLSLTCLDTASAFAEELNDQSLMSNILTNYGIVYRELGYYTKALKAYKRATVIDSLQGNVNDLAVDYMNTGNVYNELGLFRKSILFYSKAEKCFEHLRDTSGLSMVYGNLGVTHYELSDFEQSVEYLTRSMKYNRGLDSLGTANAKLNLAIVLLNQSRFDSASSLLMDAGNIYNRLSRRSEEAFCLTYMGRAFMRVGRPGEAEGCFRNAIKLFTGSDSGKEDWFVYSEYAMFKYFNGERDDAITMLKHSLQRIEEQRAVNPDEEVLTHFLENEIQSAYRFYVYINIRLGRFREALQAFEKIKARTIKGESGLSATPDPRFQFIEYFNYDSLWYAFIINGDSVETRFLTASNTLPKLVTDHYGFLQSGNSDIARLKLISKKLYDHMFKPLADLVKENQMPVIVPDGILHYLPFETLWTGSRYLIENFKIGYAPSSLINYPRFLKYPSPNEKKTLSVMAFKSDYADMEFGQSDVSYGALPFADHEKKSILDYFNDDPVIVLDKDLCETKLKEVLRDTVEILHIAAHGRNNPDFPEQSSIVLGAQTFSGEDGYLTAGEIENLSITARLVVLSACETSLGELLRSEGMLGLTRAFFRSGSSAVISSLWKIRDSATAMLMDRFYYYLKKEKREPADALQKAKTDLLRSEHYHPFYWGAFILWGN